MEGMSLVDLWTSACERLNVSEDAASKLEAEANLKLKCEGWLLP